MADLTGMMQAAAGAAAGGENLYVEDVFSTYLYTGTGAAQTITNGIDLDGEGGLVWIKSRSAATSNFLFDTERGVTDEINSDSTGAEASLANSLTAFNSDGFSISSATGIGVSAATYASWTFRKAEKFFDIVTYTGNGSARTISHNLGSAPGCVIVKKTNSTGNWAVWHRSGTQTNTYVAFLNSIGTYQDQGVNYWGSLTMSSTVFSVGTATDVNNNGDTYVAYLFAHDAGGFGDDGLQNVISCGSFTTNGSGAATVALGYEPQWILIKNIQAVEDWLLSDNMRGMPVGGAENYLRPNSSAAEASYDYIDLTATGFNPKGLNNSQAYIYIAIRRGPMKTPTAGTEVFNPVVYTGTNVDNRLVDTSLLTDMVMIKERNDTVDGMVTGDRLRGNPYLLTGTAEEENTDADTFMTPTSGVGNAFAAMNGVGVGNDATSKVNIDTTANNQVAWAFRRAPGFFDVVCYTGTSSVQNVAHNLGVAPELIIAKNRTGRPLADGHWQVYDKFNTATNYLMLNANTQSNSTTGAWNNTEPTSSVFTLGTLNWVNVSGEPNVAYLFASVAGVSKVGTYTGNGSSVTVTTGFQPRFILVKRTDSSGDWIVGDSARGLVAGNDPFIVLNDAVAETTNQDWVDVSATGFTVNETAANANVNTGTYIYLCIS